MTTITTGFYPSPKGRRPLLCPRRQFKKRLMRNEGLSPRQYRKRMNGLRREVGFDVRLRLPKWYDLLPAAPARSRRFNWPLLAVLIGAGFLIVAVWYVVASLLFPHLFAA